MQLGNWATGEHELETAMDSFKHIKSQLNAKAVSEPFVTAADERAVETLLKSDLA